MLGMIGRYELREQRVGDEMVVSSAWDPDVGRRVTIKEPLQHYLVDAAYVANFLEEGRCLASLQDEHVVTVYDVIDSVDGVERCALVLEAIDNTLDDVVSEGPVDPHAATVILRDALAGLSAIHEAGFVHANLTPRSLLVTAEGRAKIADLRMAWRGGKRRTIVVTGRSEYVAPEMWAQSGDVGPASDLYSLGCIAYEMMAGRPRFHAELAAGADTDAGDLSVASGAWHRNPSLVARPLAEIVPGVDPAVSKVVARLMEKRFELRFHGASDALEALGGRVRGAARPRAVSRTTVVEKPIRDATPPVSPGATRVVEQPTRSTSMLEQPTNWWRDGLVLTGVVVLGFFLMLLIVALG